MQHLILRPGPELVLRVFRPVPGDLGPRPRERVVTDRAHELQFDAITLHPQSTLADVFALLESSPLLKRIYRPAFVDALCAEARKGPGRDEQQHDRIEWAVSLTPLRELLALPVRVNHSVRIAEDDRAAQAWMQEIGRADVEDVTLGQLLEGLWWELSFHGGPAEQEAVSEGLRKQVPEPKDGMAETCSSDEVFERLGLPGCEGLFDEFGGLSPREVDQALRGIGDTENAAEWIANRFDGRVVVKAELRRLNGREFRRARQALRR